MLDGVVHTLLLAAHAAYRCCPTTVRVSQGTSAPWSSKHGPWWCAVRRSMTRLLPALPSLLMPQWATQSLCRLLHGGLASRNLLVDSKIGEPGEGDEHYGASTTMPAGWHHAHMWAPPEACRRRGGRRHGPGRRAPACAGGTPRWSVSSPGAPPLETAYGLQPRMVMSSLKPKYHPKKCA
jgi:hypothetical protein